MIRRGTSEYEEQKALFEMARLHYGKYPALRLMAASLNGVRLTMSQAKKAKASGMLKGEHDIHLPVARGPYHGLSIEMKANYNQPTPEQREYTDLISAEGWLAVYCWCWEDAWKIIEDYLNLGEYRWQGNEDRLSWPTWSGTGHAPRTSWQPE